MANNGFLKYAMQSIEELSTWFNIKCTNKHILVTSPENNSGIEINALAEGRRLYEFLRFLYPEKDIRLGVDFDLVYIEVFDRSWRYSHRDLDLILLKHRLQDRLNEEHFEAECFDIFPPYSSFYDESNGKTSAFYIITCPYKSAAIGISMSSREESVFVKQLFPKEKIVFSGLVNFSDDLTSELECAIQHLKDWSEDWRIICSSSGIING